MALTHTLAAQKPHKVKEETHSISDLLKNLPFDHLTPQFVTTINFITLSL